jgi:hypothetical protein
MGGRLKLRSEPGRGSAFGFTLRVRAMAGDGPRPVGKASEGA